MTSGIDGIRAPAGTTAPAPRPEVPAEVGGGGIGLQSGSSAPVTDGLGAESSFQLESTRKAYAEIFREEPWETGVRQKMEKGITVPEKQLSAYRERRFQKLMVFQGKLHEIQFEMEFASKLAEHAASAGKTVLQTQI